MHPVFNKIGNPIFHNNLNKTSTPKCKAEFEEEIIRQLKKQVVPIEKQLEKNDIFWKTVSKLNWTDKSDGIINIEDKKKIIEYNIVSFTHDLNKYIDNLRPLYINRLEITNLDGFLSHIVAKGKIFYEAVCLDILFAEYIIENHEYQSLYDCLK